MTKITFVIHLGNHWRMFANARDDLTFLGTVQHGVAAIGALARTQDGGYVQVNGDVVTALHARKIESALRMRWGKAPPCANRPLDDRLLADPARLPEPILEPGNPTPAPAPAPVITVKKRRVAVRATTEAAHRNNRRAPDATRQEDATSGESLSLMEPLADLQHQP
ncbi:hypothetical protein ASC78_03945 [Variovorax sp. Root318D1]|uniref:hypothetical protein n=1 Tax=Variovorax sp. Root318D1 TaxID=1736513 RepID=UPI0006FA40D4|nr:hypothetical protein [Variovorax sp. Root318D1]KQU86730.1 hypothetical protein ASC78_03945 [Variovorax sp. Root318D1]